MPYIASSMESEFLPGEHLESALWSEEFLGNGDGFVVIGPFSQWNTLSGPLVRNAGLTGQPFTNDGVNKILAQNRTADILSPRGSVLHNLELQHDMAHLFFSGSGGQMSDLNTAPQDPLFFNHHAFVDYIWEEFRNRQKQVGINPANDYPSAAGNPRQAPNAPMRFGTLRNIDGYSDYFTSDIYRYEMVPTCTRARGCGSDYLRCEMNNGPPHCVSILKSEMPGNKKATRVKRAVTESQTLCMQAKERVMQNTYSCNEFPDIREWAYLPVDVIYRRRPRQDYNSYPVFNGTPMLKSDMYSPKSYIGLDTALPNGNPKGFFQCDKGNGNSGKVLISSSGMNYFGNYGDFVNVDERLAISRSTGYAGVKSPETGGATEVLVNVHDSCGRVCKPYCRYELEGKAGYQPCTGAVRVTSNLPKMYGRTYGETVLDTWQFPTNGDCPDPDIGQSTTFLRFYCDFSDDWPFPAISPHPSAPMHPSTHVQSAQQNNAQSRSRSSVMVSSGSPSVQG